MALRAESAPRAVGERAEEGRSKSIMPPPADCWGGVRGDGGCSSEGVGPGGRWERGGRDWEMDHGAVFGCAGDSILFCWRAGAGTKERGVAAAADGTGVAGFGLRAV